MNSYNHNNFTYITPMKRILFSLIIITFSFAEIPEYRVVAEWEPALGTMIRWPLGIPSELIVELAEDDRLYVLVENTNQENLARNNFNSWNINMLNIVFIFTESYSHWTRDHGPQFLIGENHWEVVNQEFNGYPVESGCEFECDEEMIFFDCMIYVKILMVMDKLWIGLVMGIVMTGIGD
jgi:hypothetical protein